MTTRTDDRLSVRARADVPRSSFPEVVAHLAKIIGRKLTAYIRGVDDVCSVDHWIEGLEVNEIAGKLPEMLDGSMCRVGIALDKATVLAGQASKQGQG
jgi:hypothetical protein